MQYLFATSLVLISVFDTSTGITTLIGGGTGPAHGTCATTCTPAPAHIEMMLRATDDMPVNIGFTGKVGFFASCPAF